MEWLVILAFAIFLTGLGIVVRDAISHAHKSSPQKPEKPTQ
ncbi:MAG: hypothetical protein OXC18_16455 [Desulfurellaceae bacterium]|nr:hypothetical protein [Desulfurellaceae bacterium]